MNLTHKEAISIEPIINYPRRAAVGRTYLMTIDLCPHYDPDAWPYLEEELSLTCILETLPLFSHKPLSTGTVILHRFGGTYGPASFLLTALEVAQGNIRITLVNDWGMDVEVFDLSGISVSEEITQAAEEVEAFLINGITPVKEQNSVSSEPPLLVEGAIKEQVEAFQHSETITELIAALFSDSSSARQVAAKALGELRDSSIIPPLVAAMQQDANSSIRQTIVKALGKLDDPSVVPILVTVLQQDESSQVRRTAIAALKNVSDASIVPILVTALQQDKHRTVREAAIKTLGALGDTSIIPILVTALQRDESSAVRRAAVWELAESEDISLVPILLSVLQRDEHIAVRAAAMKALLRLARGKSGVYEAVAMQFDNLHLERADLKRVNLPRADMTDSNLRGANLRHAWLYAANLRGASLANADLSGANLREAVLRSADLTGSKLLRTDLSSADLGSASLRGADLTLADLNRASLRGATLAGSTCSRANLSLVDLSENNLTGADFTSVNLRNAKVTAAQLSLCKSLDSATLPYGTTFDETYSWREPSEYSTSQVSTNKQLTDILAKEARIASNCDTTLIYTYDFDKRTFILQATGGLRSPSKNRRAHTLSSNAIMDLLQGATVQFLESIDQESLISRSGIVEIEKFMACAVALLKVKSELVGAVFFMYRTVQNFTEQQTIVIHRFVNWASQFTVDALQRQQLASIRQAITRAEGANDINSFLMAVLEHIHKTLSNSKSNNLFTSIGIRSDDTVELVASYPPVARSPFSRTLTSLSDRGPIGIVGRTITTQKSQLVPDVRSDPMYLPIIDTTRSEIAVPLIGNEGVVGVINVESPQLDAFTKHDVAYLEAFAHYMTPVLTEFLSTNPTPTERPTPANLSMVEECLQLLDFRYTRTSDHSSLLIEDFDNIDQHIYRIATMDTLGGILLVAHYLPQAVASVEPNLERRLLARHSDSTVAFYHYDEVEGFTVQSLISKSNFTCSELLKSLFEFRRLMSFRTNDISLLIDSSDDDPASP